MDFGDGIISASGGSNMVTKKKKIVFKKIELKKKGEVVKGGEVEKPAQKKPIVGKRRKEEKKKPKITLPEIELKKKPSLADKASAVFTNPIETVTKGFEAGLEKQESQSVGENLLRASGTGAVAGAGIGLAGAAIAGRTAASAAIKVSPKIIQGIRERLTLTKFAQGGGTRAIAGKEVIATGKNAVLRNTFKTNIKSQGLTQAVLAKVGLTIPSASILLGAIGSYPFAGFIKEEALQTLSFGTKVAIDSGDLDQAQASIDQVNEVLNPSAIEKLIATVPYANVVKQLLDFFEAAATKNTADQKSLDKKRAIAEGDIESDFARERRVSDEAAFERKRAFGEEESARFEGIREENEAREAAAAERETADREAETQRFEQIEADRTAAANEEKRLNSIYFQLLRDKKFDEAEEFRKINFPT